MRPLTVISGIVLGTCLSIAVSLGAVLLMYAVLGDAYPRVEAERPSLLASLAIFTGMTAISALSFYGLLIGHPARFLGQLAMWGGVLATGFYFWPY